MLTREQDWMKSVDMARLMLLIVDDQVMHVVMIVVHNQQHSQEYVRRLLHRVDSLEASKSASSSKLNPISYVHYSNDTEERCRKRTVYDIANLYMKLIGIRHLLKEKMWNCLEMETLMATMMTDCLAFLRSVVDSFVSIVGICYYYFAIYDHQRLSC